MPRRTFKTSPYSYEISHEDGTLEHEGPTSPPLSKAIVAVYTMAERGENNWEYSVHKADTGEPLVAFKRTALGVHLSYLGPLPVPPVPPVPPRPKMIGGG